VICGSENGESDPKSDESVSGGAAKANQRSGSGLLPVAGWTWRAGAAFWWWCAAAAAAAVFLETPPVGLVAECGFCCRKKDFMSPPLVMAPGLRRNGGRWWRVGRKGMGVDWGAAAEGGGRRTDRSGAGGQVYMVGARDGGAAVQPLWGCGRDFEF
jgi:hypothetical protein